MTRMRKDVDRIIDEVALERALDGDRSAFNNLTRMERTEFYNRASSKSELFRKRFGRINGNADTASEFDWLSNLRENLGVSYATMDQNMVRARRRAQRRQA